MRGPADEEPRISTPRVSQEKPPSPSLPRKKEDSSTCLLPGERGLWPATDPAVQSLAPGRAPASLDPQPPTPRAGQAGGVKAAGSGWVAWVNGAAIRGATGRRGAGSSAWSVLRDCK